MQRIFHYTMLALLWQSSHIFCAPLSIPITSESGILMNLETGTVLSCHNPDTPLYPASITKVATALYALKLCGDQVGQMVTVKAEALASITPQAKKQSNYRSPPYWLETDGNHIGLKKGEEIPLRELLHALLIASANDAANVIAQHLGGTIPKFMDALNSYLKQLGCKNTHFLNPHGFHHPAHLTTARDMALIAREAMKYPLFREMVAKVRHTCPQTNLEQERNLLQTNLLLRQGSYYYPQAIGIKTGTTTAAGKTLIAAARVGERTLIAVVLGNRDKGGRYEDVIKMFETAAKEPRKRRFLLKKGLQEFTKTVVGGRQPLKVSLAQDLYFDFYPTEEPVMKTSVVWHPLKLPIEPNQEVGEIKVVDAGGGVLQQQKLYAAVAVEPTFIWKCKAFLSEGNRGKKGLFGGGVAMLLLFFWKLRKRKPNRSSRLL